MDVGLEIMSFWYFKIAVSRSLYSSCVHCFEGLLVCWLHTSPKTYKLRNVKTKSLRLLF